jgi:hypothetical protein
MEHLGYYDFDDLSLQHQLKIKLPCVMQLYSEITASTSGVDAAKELRSRCAIWRESMRKFWEDLFNPELAVDEWPKSIDEWSKSVPDFEEKQVTATLRRSQIIGIKLLKAGNDHFDDILYRVPFYRLSLDSVWLFRIVISASMHAGLRMIPRESAFFSRACKPISLEDCPLSRHCEGVCPPDIMVCALVRGSPRDIRGDSRCKSH